MGYYGMAWGLGHIRRSLIRHIHIRRNHIRRRIRRSLCMHVYYNNISCKIITDVGS